MLYGPDRVSLKAPGWVSLSILAAFGNGRRHSTRARRLARRFRTFEDLILRFATCPDLEIFTSNQAERTMRPVKVQQRGSGGAWRTLDAIVESYLSTAVKWGISKLDALRGLFNRRAWQPPGLQLAG